MSIGLAIKRSYRYFLPPSMLHPRQLVRDHYAYAFFFVLGVSFGGLWCVTPGDQGRVERITYWTTTAFIALLFLKNWANGTLRLPRWLKRLPNS